MLASCVDVDDEDHDGGECEVTPPRSNSQSKRLHSEMFPHGGGGTRGSNMFRNRSRKQSTQNRTGMLTPTGLGGLESETHGQNRIIAESRGPRARAPYPKPRARPSGPPGRNPVHVAGPSCWPASVGYKFRPPVLYKAKWDVCVEAALTCRAFWT